MGLDKFNLDAYTLDVFCLSGGITWNLRESFILGMTFGYQQTVDGFKVTSLDEVTRGMCKERREQKFLCTRHKSRFWKFNRSKRKHLLSFSSSSGFVMSLLPPPGSSLSRLEISIGVI